MELLEAAILYAQQGWCVFPLKPRDKVPAISKHEGGNGCHDATTDPAVIRRWWTDRPLANVGIATGAISGLVVLDVDGPAGEASLASLLNGEEPPQTPTARTGQGRHVLFAHPGRSIGNKAAMRPGLDLRGDGGYIVGAPSVHSSGIRYAWELRPCDVPLAPMPEWLLALLEKPKPRPAPAIARERPGRASPWSEKALREECQRMVQAKAGTRNDTLNRAAFSLGQLVGAGHLERDRVEADLYAAAESCGLVTDDGEATVRGTMLSGLEDGIRAPRGPRERARPLRVVVSEASEAPNLTDMGNAERFAVQHQGQVRYCHPWREWLVWDGRRWTRDRTGEAWRRAKQTARSMLHEAADLEDDRARRELAKHAMQSEAQRRIAGMMELAKSDPRIAALPEAFDGEGTRYLLNLPNGTLDLHTGEMRDHRPADLITRLAPVEYRPQATCPAWDGFLARVVPDSGVRDFLRRFVGYALTGDTSEQVFCLLYGTGANGKSTFLETLKTLLGDYAHQASFETFLAAPSKSDRRGAPRSDIMALQGARLVAAIEAGEGRRLDENTIKQLTGTDTVTARGLYQSETSFMPEAKLIFAANHRPEIRGTDLAIWRRVLEVPFAVTIPEKERDTSLLARLREPAELSGMLAWAVAGCNEWRTATAPRLRPPEAVIAATRGYREEEDCLAPFLEDRCILDPEERVANRDLREAYRAWCKAAGESPLTPKALAKRLQDRGLRSYREAQVRGWEGVRLRTIFDDTYDG